jgi:hypothetical protein
MRWHVAQDRVQWRALVGMALNVWVEYRAGNFLHLKTAITSSFSRTQLQTVSTIPDRLLLKVHKTDPVYIGTGSLDRYIHDFIIFYVRQ